MLYLISTISTLYLIYTMPDIFYSLFNYIYYAISIKSKKYFNIFLTIIVFIYIVAILYIVYI